MNYLKKILSKNIYGPFCLVFFIYMASFILLEDSSMPFSISSVQILLNHFLKHWHGVVIFILPIYVALWLIGAGISGLMIGALLYHSICKRLKTASRSLG